MFEGDFADTGAEHFHSCQWGAEQPCQVGTHMGNQDGIGEHRNL